MEAPLGQERACDLLVQKEVRSLLYWLSLRTLLVNLGKKWCQITHNKIQSIPRHSGHARNIDMLHLRSLQEANLFCHPSLPFGCNRPTICRRCPIKGCLTITASNILPVPMALQGKAMAAMSDAHIIEISVSSPSSSLVSRFVAFALLCKTHTSVFLCPHS